MHALPPWIVFHVPHDSFYIPPEVRRGILLSDAELDREFLRMTDVWTQALFAAGVPRSQVTAAPVSRLVVDTERFEDDALEIMAARGMGVVYEVTHDLKPLRRKVSAQERERLLARWYRPHHRCLTQRVDGILERWGRALVIDAHSFPSRALPYEDDPTAPRPEVCIGTDGFHTPPEVAAAFSEAFSRAGWDTGLNSPFAGALVPMKHFGSDRRVSAVMIETRRDLYADESTGALHPDFVRRAADIRSAVAAAAEAL